MNTKKIFASHRFWIGALLMLAFISACSGAPKEAPPTTAPTRIPTKPPSAPTEIPATTEAQGGFQPSISTMCSDLAGAMALTLDVQVLEMEAPFEDYISGKTGTGCQAMAEGTGLDFESFVAVADTMRGILEAKGWQEDVRYAADGPTGTATGFRKANALCLLSVNWEPSENADCPPDQPISACELAPDQQLYSIILNCAEDM
jgi:hypothetical protein